MIVTTIYDDAGYTITGETNQGIYDIHLINVSKNIFKDTYKKVVLIVLGEEINDDHLYLFKLEYKRYKKKFTQIHSDIIRELKKGIATNKKYGFKELLTKIYNDSNINNHNNWVYEYINAL